jgi:hypothetical protein
MTLSIQTEDRRRDARRVLQAIQRNVDGRDHAEFFRAALWRFIGIIVLASFKVKGFSSLTPATPVPGPGLTPRQRRSAVLNGAPGSIPPPRPPIQGRTFLQ